MGADPVVFLVGGWLLTYLIHSTLLLGPCALLTIRRRWWERVGEVGWKVAILGGIVTSALQASGLAGNVLEAIQGPATQSPALRAAQALSISSIANLHPLGTTIVTIGVSAWLLVAIGGLVGLIRARQKLANLLEDRIDIRQHGEAWKLGDVSGSAVRLTVAEGITTPLALGSNEICIPARAMARLSTEQLAAVVAHEGEHLAGKDPAWRIVILVIERIFFFQPLHRIARSRVRALAEFRCDQAAVKRTSPVAVASALVSVAEWAVGSPRIAAVGMIGPESIAIQRVRRILAGTTHSTGHGVPVSVLGAILFLLGTLGPTVGVVPLGGPALRYTIDAFDSGGPFTVTMERGKVLGATMGGMEVPANLIQQVGDRVHVGAVGDHDPLDLLVTANGGLHWDSRPARTAPD